MFREQHVCLLKMVKKTKRMTKDEEAAIVKGFTFLPDNERVEVENKKRRRFLCCVVINGKNCQTIAEGGKKFMKMCKLHYNMMMRHKDNVSEVFMLL